MEEQTDKFESFLKEARDYFHTRQELLKLQLTEKVAVVFSGMIAFFIILSIFLLTFLFVSLSLAQLFSEWWGYEYAGYLTVTILYTIILLLMIRFRKNLLVKPIMNMIIKIILSGSHHGNN